MPFQLETKLPITSEPQFVDVTVFDFKKQLLALLEDPFIFQNIDKIAMLSHIKL